MAPRNDFHDFLTKDLYDSLRWLFEGAVAWEAARTKPNPDRRHQQVFGMFTSLVQARSLYEFFYGKRRDNGDDARASDFASNTGWKAPTSQLYKRYMETGKPAQKRVFHLVFNRSTHSGGAGSELNTKVVEFAVEIRGLVEDFEWNADPEFREDISCALARAILEADKAAKFFGIARPV